MGIKEDIFSEYIDLLSKEDGLPPHLVDATKVALESGEINRQFLIKLINSCLDDNE